MCVYNNSLLSGEENVFFYTEPSVCAQTYTKFMLVQSEWLEMNFFNSTAQLFDV